LGFLGAVALVVAAEWAVFGPFDDPVSFGAASWRDGGRAAAHEAVDGAVLCFGDSQVKCGILPAVLERRLGLPAYNLAVIGGQAPGSFYLFERALRAGAKPRAIVVGYYPALLGCDLRLNAGLWPELLDPGGCLDLLLGARDTRLAGPLLTRAVLPSLRRRADVAAAVRGGPDPGRDDARAYRRNWRVNGGAHALPVGRALVDESRPEAGGGRWKCKPENARYVRRFLALAAARGVPVFWLLPTNAPGLTAARLADGRDAAYDRYVAAVQAEFPGLTVIDPRPALTDPAAFSDVCHLNRRGAVALSLAVADVLDRSLSGRDPSHRVALPAGAVAASGIPGADAWASLEDVGQSSAALRAGGGDAPARVAGAPGQTRR